MARHSISPGRLTSTPGHPTAGATLTVTSSRSRTVNFMGRPEDVRGLLSKGGRQRENIARQERDAESMEKYQLYRLYCQ